MKDMFDSILLVMPSSHNDYVLIGTNILSLLDINKVKDKTVLDAVRLARGLTKFDSVRSDSNIVVKSNTVYFCTGHLRVRPTSFIRTVMLTPTQKAMNVLSGRTFAGICYYIPANKTVVNVPYRVMNFSDRDVILRRVVPLYTVNTVSRVFQEQNDPREETIPDKDF